MHPPPRPSLIEIAPEATRPTALPDHVFAVLKQQILSCVLKPGERLVEKALCDHLRVSRTPVREALNRLSHEDLVTFQPHAGYRVAPITLEAFRHLIELRAIIEPQATALAAERATPEQITDMRARATLPYDPNTEQGFADYCRANARFHLSVVRAAHNPMIEHLVMSTLDLYQRPTYLQIGRQLDPKNPSSKHHAIVDAIERRDGPGAAAIMTLHIRGGGDRIIAALRAAQYH